MPPDHPARLARARLALEGLSLGDAFGQKFFLPRAEAVRRIAAREAPPPPWRWTDDTEMALSVVETLAACGRIDQDRLARAFASRYDPDRDYGAMAAAILRDIAAGVPWRTASYAAFDGQGSFGNGAAMRAAPVGAYFADDLGRVVEEARLSAEVTHAHREGQAGAIAVAVAAALVWQGRAGGGAAGPELLRRVAEHVPDGATRTGIVDAAGLPEGTAAQDAALRLGSGREITAPDTVPFCLWCIAHTHGSFADALWTAVRGLGDRDTTCAVVGGVVALAVGEAGLPAEWLAAREPLPRLP